jgi:hypothetical protein
MWAWWSSHHDTGRHEDHPIPRLARSGSIEVPQQGDLGTVVDHLAMDMQDQRCHDSVSKPGSRHRSGQAVEIELADAGNPPRILPVEC